MEDFASAFIRLEGGGTLILEAGWATYRDEKDLMDFTVYGTDGGADLRSVGASENPVADVHVFTEKDGENADFEVVAEPGRAHQAVVDDFIAAVRGGETVWGGSHDGSLALSRAWSSMPATNPPSNNVKWCSEMSDSKLKIVVWNEAVHEARNEPATIGEMYPPEGIHGAIAAGLRGFYPDSEISTATLADPEHGLSEEVLEQTDVLLWWGGHIAHQEVADEVVERVQRHVLAGMGLVVLHSGHFAKIFTRLLGGTTCSLKWRNEGERELVWTVKPSHPIAAGIESPIVIPQQEMYGELFDIPRTR